MSLEKVCPECGGPVDSDLACHTWSRTNTREDGTTWEQWMSCMPCDSATRWSCVAWQPEDYVSQEKGWMEEGDIGMGCGWRWTNGLNPNNPRAEENETHNPHWGEE